VASDRVSRPSFRRRATLVGLGVGVPLSALFLWLAVKSTDLGSVWRTLKAARTGDLAGAVVAMAAVYVVQALRWRVIAHGAASRRRYVGLVVGGVAANNVLPGRVGDGLRGVWLARAESIPSGRALATVVFDRGADVVALVGLLAVSLPFTVHPAWLLRIVIGGVVLAVILVGALIAAHVVARVHRRAERVRSRARRVARDLLDGLAQPPSPARIATALALSFVAWGIWTLGAWLVARSLGIELGVFDALLVAAVVNLGVAIPSSPGFIGTYQWLCVSTLSLLDIGRNKALAFSILLHASWFVPSTIAGGLFLATRLIRRARTNGRILESESASSPRS
jgi:glycosyltransferase 2 family protein